MHDLAAVCSECFSLVRESQRDTDNRAVVDEAHAENDSAESRLHR